MNHTTLKQFGIGFVLALVGVTLFFVQKNDTTTLAQANTTYSSTWKATKVLTVRAQEPSFNTGNAGIGVWEWQVNGTVGSKTYSETWSAPGIAGVSFDGVTAGSQLWTPQDRGCSIIGVDDTKLMAGCYFWTLNFGRQIIGANPNYVFEVMSTRGYSGTNSIDGAPNRGAGRQATTSCGTPYGGGPTINANCMAQSGAYSFSFVGSYGSNGADADGVATFGQGTLMPLEWTVSGTISN